MPTPPAIDAPPAKPAKPEPEIRTQRVKDPVTGAIKDIRVKILRGGRRREPARGEQPAAK